jgi:predicted LPLAT superfamily acyltransferase
MFIFVACLIAVVGFFMFAASRGRKAVRAYVYMAARCDGASEHEANALALRIDTHRAGQMNTAMMEFVKISYNGSQLRMISDARLDGFHQ